VISLTIFRYELQLYVLGWLLALSSALTESIVLLELGFLAFGLAGVRRLIMIVLRPERHWSLCSILAGGGIATYYLEAFLTLIQYNPNTVDQTLLLGDNFPSAALFATAYLNLFAWMLILFSAFEHRFWNAAFAPLRAGAGGAQERRAQSAIILYLLAVSVTQAILMYSGKWSFQGITAHDSQIPVLASFVDNLSWAVPILCGWSLGQSRKSTRALAIVGLALACEIVWLGAEGRRSFAFGTMTFLLGYVWAGSQINWKRVVPVILPALPVVYFAAKMFLAMRIASFSMTHQADLSTFLHDAWYVATEQSADLAQVATENYATRLFTIQYLVTVVNDLTVQNAQYGLFAFIAFLTNVPRVLFPLKSTLFVANQWGADGKGILNQVMGLPTFDANWSPFVEGYGDFMWLGAVAYPMIILLLGIFCAKIVKGLRSRPYVIGALGMCLIDFLQVETTLGALIALVRPLVFLFVFAKAMSFVNAPRAGTTDRVGREAATVDQV
jgi:hypothetical protein